MSSTSTSIKEMKFVHRVTQEYYLCNTLFFLLDEDPLQCNLFIFFLQMFELLSEFL